MTGHDPASGSPRVRVDVLLDEDERRSELREATAIGLRDTPKRVPVIWLYDETGSRIFDEITRLPEYYPTRREREILQTHAADIAAQTRADTLVELGSGTSEKTRLLLDALARAGSLTRFVPLDVSEEVLVASAREIARDYPGLDVHAIVGDFQRDLAAIPAGARRLVAFLGSTIGNLSPGEVPVFSALRRSRSAPATRCCSGSTSSRIPHGSRRRTTTARVSAKGSSEMRSPTSTASSARTSVRRDSSMPRPGMRKTSGSTSASAPPLRSSCKSPR
jgi:hypothetical protein